jgi:hypothetical protein
MYLPRVFIENLIKVLRKCSRNVFIFMYHKKFDGSYVQGIIVSCPKETLSEFKQSNNSYSGSE